MKKSIFTIMIALFTVGYVHAQTGAGSMYLGGTFNLGFNSEKYKTGGTTTDGPKTTNFGITPQLGYFLSEDLMVGLGIGYTSTTTTQKGNGITTPDEEKTMQSMFDLTPFVRYYMMPTEKFGFFGQGEVSFGFGKDKYEQTYGSNTTTQESKVSSFGVGIIPGIVIHMSEKVELESTFGGLMWSMTKDKNKDNDNENSYSNFSLAVNPWVTVGVAVVFGK